MFYIKYHVIKKHGHLNYNLCMCLCVGGYGQTRAVPLLGCTCTTHSTSFRTQFSPWILLREVFLIFSFAVPLITGELAREIRINFSCFHLPLEGMLECARVVDVNFHAWLFPWFLGKEIRFSGLDS